MSSLPTLAQIAASSPGDDNSALSQFLSTIFEPSSVLSTYLVPQLTAPSNSSPALRDITSYESLIDIALRTITSSRDPSLQSQFISGHPRIGQVKNLSKLSEEEQARVAVPAEVISRLEHLNKCYERKYPGLRYITFVNGRSRAEIVVEMERFLGVRSDSELGVESIEPVIAGGDEWKAELDRAIGDVGLIAKSRLVVFGVN